MDNQNTNESFPYERCADCGAEVHVSRLDGGLCTQCHRLNFIDRMALEAGDGCPVAIPVDEFRRYGRWQPDAEEATA